MAGEVKRAVKTIQALLLAVVVFLSCSSITAAQEGWSMLIREIEIDESLWRWEGKVADSLSLNVGQPYRPADAARSINLLMATGNFKSVEILTFFSPEGVKLKFELVPQNIVSEVNIKGNFFILKKEIRPVIRTTPNEVYDLKKVQEDAEKIKNVYKRQGFFETEIKLDLKPEKDGLGIKVEFEIDEGKPGVIQRVSFQGNEQISEQNLSIEHKLISLSFFSPEKLDVAIERLLDFYRQKGFIEAEIDAEYEIFSGLSLPSLTLVQPLKSLRALLPGEYVGVDVIFKIVEGDQFDIRVEGNEEVKDKTIKGLMTFYQEGFFDQFEADESRDAVVSYYRDNGYYHASVSIDLDQEKKTALMKIYEGSQVRINRIRFSGNTIITSRSLRRLMASRPGRIRRKIYRADVLEKDLNRIKAYYLSKGFTKASVFLEEHDFSDDMSKMAVNIVIEEGPQTKIKEVLFSGAAVFDEERLSRAIGWRPFLNYNPDWISTAKKKILDLYSRLGYADCTINAIEVFSPDRETVNVEFNVREGRQSRFGKLMVMGNKRTDPRIVTREFALKSGDPYDTIKTFQGRRRLFELGLFSRVELINPRRYKDEETDLIVKVREKKSSRLAVAAGYDSEEKSRGSIEIGQNNLWGTARAVRLRYKLSSLGRRYDLFYKEPWIFGFEQDINLDLFDETRKEIGYNLKRTGARLFSDRLLNRFTDLYTEYKYEAVDLTDIQPSLIVEEDPVEEFRISSVMARLSYEHRDNVVNPHRGYHASASALFASSILGSEAEFNKYEIKAAYVQPLSSISELVFSTRMGVAQRIDSKERIPLSERFFAGGATTVRGYAEKTLGPKDKKGNPLGGELLLLGNIEWRFKIYRNFGGVLFFDSGNVWRRPEKFDFHGIKESVGAGIRYDTPVGPARLEYGYKLDPEPDEEKYRIHFTLGHPF